MYRLVLVVFLTLGLAAVASPASAEDAEEAVFTLGMLGDIDSANPFVGYSGSAYEIFQMEYLTLTQYSADDLSIVPGLAESWEESADQLSWTYTIRPGMLWSDGVPITARDVKFTFDRILNGKQEAVNYYAYTESIESVEVIDDLTVRILVDKPSPIMQSLYVYILPEHIWQSVDRKEVKTFANEGTPGDPIVGSGPFLMVERRPGQFIRFTANRNYFRGEPAVREVIWRIYNNADALGLALQSGEIDAATDLTAPVWESLKDLPGITTVASTNTYFNHVAFNTGAALVDGTPIGDGNQLLTDSRIRQALSLSIDRQAMVDRILQGLGEPGSTIIPPIYSRLHLPGADLVDYDPDRARQILDEAGYTLGPDGIRVDQKGNRLSFRMFGRADSDADSTSILEFLKQYFAEVGVELNTSMVSTDAIISKYGEGNYDLYEWGWGVEPDPNYMLSAMTCANRSYKDGDAIYSTLSDSFYCNPAYDELWLEQSAETDPERRAQIVQQMQQILIDDMPYLVLFYPNQLTAYRSDRFGGFVPQPADNGALLFQYGTWTWDGLTPASAEAAAAEIEGSTQAAGPPADAPKTGGSSVPTALAAAFGLGVIVIVALVVLLVRQRRHISADSRE